ncbi:MAG: peroxide stress protein YaaA, partial [Lachnospiraceae bacterium]|nr:peroxide stress protein YaaA [Lachnospiraceae bacterium]
YCKMARGEMVRFMAENRIEKPEGIKQFSVMRYRFSEALSSEKEYIFVRKKE